MTYMDMPPGLHLRPTELELMRALSDREVNFIAIGSTALGAHGVVRPRDDLDIMVEPTTENIGRLRDILVSLHIPITEEHVEKLLSDTDTLLNIGNAGLQFCTSNT